MVPTPPVEKANNFNEQVKQKLTINLLSCSTKRLVSKALFFFKHSSSWLVCQSKRKKISSPEMSLSSKISLRMDLKKTLFNLTFILKLCKVISWSGWIALCGDIRNGEISGLLKISYHTVSPLTRCRGIATGKPLCSIVLVLTWIKHYPWMQLLTKVIKPRNCLIDLVEFESGAHNSCKDERSYPGGPLLFHHNKIRNLPKNNTWVLFHWQRGFCKCLLQFCKHELAPEYPLH